MREVKSVSPGEVVIVTLEGNEQTLKADGVVVATGSVQASPLMKDSTGKSKEERRAQFVAFRDSVKTSKGVLVVGGGTTGVELASEIATDFPGVKTTLISKSELLLRNTASREKVHTMAMKALKKQGVTVITGDYVEGLKEDYSGEPKTFSTLKGVNIEADLVVICAGGQPCIPFPTAPEAVDDDTRGLVVTNAMLCEKLSDDPTKPIWAVGDCTMYGGRAAFGGAQTAALSASLEHFEMTGSTAGGPSKYSHKDIIPSLISLGRRDGIATVPFPNHFLAKLFKSKDMMVPFMYKKDFGVKN